MKKPIAEMNMFELLLYRETLIKHLEWLNVYSDAVDKYFDKIHEIEKRLYTFNANMPLRRTELTIERFLKPWNIKTRRSI